MQKLLTVDGGIGYSDIATARANGYAITPGRHQRDDDIFWTQVQNPSEHVRRADRRPERVPHGRPKGANCDARSRRPERISACRRRPATGRTRAASTRPTGYAICTLTYGLAFDDYKTALQPGGLRPTGEEQKARTVKDYWTSIISDGGQEPCSPATTRAAAEIAHDHATPA